MPTDVPAQAASPAPVCPQGPSLPPAPRTPAWGKPSRRGLTFQLSPKVKNQPCVRPLLPPSQSTVNSVASSNVNDSPYRPGA